MIDNAGSVADALHALVGVKKRGPVHGRHYGWLLEAIGEDPLGVRSFTISAGVDQALSVSIDKYAWVAR